MNFVAQKLKQNICRDAYKGRYHAPGKISDGNLTLGLGANAAQGEKKDKKTDNVNLDYIYHAKTPLYDYNIVTLKQC